MKKTKGELSRIAYRAVETRKRNIRHVRSREAGLKARKVTLEPVEYGYIDELAKMLKLSKSRIFHHEGLPDIMAITDEGKLRFYEMKPKKGSSERTRLNPRQVEAIKRLLAIEWVEEVNLVRYEKQREKARALWYSSCNIVRLFNPLFVKYALFWK